MPPTTVERLETLFRSTDDPKRRHRLPVVRMAHRRRPRQDIAADLGVHRKTVTRWLNADGDGGLDALRPKKAAGTPGHIPETLADTVRRWVIGGPAACGLDRANGTHEELAGHLLATQGVRTSRSAVQRFRSRIGIRPYRSTCRYLRGDAVEQAKAKGGDRPGKRAAAGELVLPSQDEARVPTVPTLAATLGVEGHRPTVGTRDCKDLLSVFAVINLATAGRYANLLDSPKNAKKKTGTSKTRRMQEAFAAHLRHVGRMDPAEQHRRVVLVIDNAPWHRGKPIDAQPAVRHPGRPEDLAPRQPDT